MKKDSKYRKALEEKERYEQVNRELNFCIGHTPNDLGGKVRFEVTDTKRAIRVVHVNKNGLSNETISALAEAMNKMSGDIVRCAQKFAYMKKTNAYFDAFNEAKEIVENCRKELGDEKEKGK